MPLKFSFLRDCPSECPSEFPSEVKSETSTAKPKDRQLEIHTTNNSKKKVKFVDLSERQKWILYTKEERPAVKAAMRKHLYMLYAKSITSIANSYYNRKVPKNSILTEHDLSQAALRRHCSYIDKYDPSVGTTYMEFFNSRDNSALIGAIIDCQRNVQDVPRSVASSRRIIKPLMEALTHKLCKTPTIEEFCDEYGRHWEYIIKDPLFKCSTFQCSQTEDGDEEYRNVIYTVKCREDYGELSERDKQDITGIINSSIEDEKVRLAMFMYYVHHRINGEIAQVLGVSPSTVSKLLVKGRSILRLIYIDRREKSE